MVSIHALPSAFICCCNNLSSNQGIYDQKEHVKQVIKHPELLPNGVTPEGYTDAISRRVSAFGLYLLL
jgi:hypothetical protein